VKRGTQSHALRCCGARSPLLRTAVTSAPVRDNKKMQSKSADDAGEADWQVPILQPGQYPVTASTSLSVGRTLPRQLDPEFYARILRSSEPEADFQVPIRAKWLHFSQLEPGHIFMINRPGWTVARSRASQKRLRGGEDQPCNGGWNR